MSTAYGNPFWDEPKRQAPQKDPWYMEPKWWGYLTVVLLAAVWTAAYGVFWQSVLLTVCLAIATGKYTITELYVMEDVDDPFAR
jgi:hypothetical protein